MLPVAILPDSPSAEEDHRGPVRSWMLVVSAVSVLASGAIYLTVFMVGQGFENLFRGLGPNLPVLTKLVLASYQLCGLLFLVAFLPCVMLFRNRVDFVAKNNRRFMLVLVGFGLSFSILNIFVVAMYLPIFEIGAGVP